MQSKWCIFKGTFERQVPCGGGEGKGKRKRNLNLNLDPNLIKEIIKLTKKICSQLLPGNATDSLTQIKVKKKQEQEKKGVN